MTKGLAIMIAVTIDDLAQFAFHASLWGPLGAFVLAVVVFKDVSVAPRVTVASLWAVAVFVLLTGFWFGVLFRDGLGPGMVSSEGWIAIARSAGPVALGLALASTLGSTAYWLGKNARRHPDR